MKYIFAISLFLILINCSDSSKKNHSKSSGKTYSVSIETYFSQGEMLPSHNGCCTFSTILQIKNDNFRYYYLNDQGDYTTINVIDGLVVKENDSVFSLKPKLDSANQKVSYDSNEFFKQKFTKNKAGIKTSSAFYTKKTFEDIILFTLERSIYGDPYFQEKFTLKKDSLLYENMIAQNGQSPKEIKKKFKLNDDELNEIANIFDNNFLCEKKITKGEIFNYSHINFDKTTFKIPLNSAIQNYFFTYVKKRFEL